MRLDAQLSELKKPVDLKRYAILVNNISGLTASIEPVKINLFKNGFITFIKEVKSVA